MVYTSTGFVCPGIAYGGLQLRVRCGAICLIALSVALSGRETCASKQLAPPLPYTQLQTALVIAEKERGTKR